MFLIGDIGWHRLAKKTLEEFDFSENQILQYAIDGRLVEPEWKSGIGLYGGVGVGKTHLLILLYKNRVWWAVNSRGKLPFPRWVSFYDLVMDVKKNGIDVVDQVVMDSQIIFVDDFLVRSLDWELEKRVAAMIVFRVYDTEKRLCFTSNFSIDEWDVDRRVIDRVREMCDIFEVVGTSRRELCRVLE